MDHVPVVVLYALLPKVVTKDKLDVGITVVLIHYKIVKKLFKIKKQILQIPLLDVQMVQQDLVY
jgi:hypothetical protein